MLDSRIKARDAGMRIGPVEIMKDTLASGGMAHDDNFAVSKFVHLVALDILHTLGNLVRVSIQISKTP